MTPWRAPWSKTRRRAWDGLWLALALVLPASAAMGASASLVSPLRTQAGAGLIDVRFGGDVAVTRVVLDLDAPVAGTILEGESTAGRLVIGLPALRAARPAGGRGQGLVTGWGVGDDGRGARLVLNLAPGAKAMRRFLIPPSAEGLPWRYVVDIEDVDPVGALAASFPGSPPPTQGPPQGALAPARVLAAVRAAPAKAPGARVVKVIVIDAGHGGHDPGARSLVRNEKDITLATALALKARLEAMGRYRVVLTRDSDVFVPLDARVQIARRAGADLFISLHADSAGSDPTPHGASVYTLSDHGQTRVTTVLGPHEWFAHAGGGQTEPGVGRILLDLTQRNTLNRSSQFAGLLIEHIGDRVDLLPRSHRDAGYFVLLAPDVPAVLLEMGFITNPADALRLTDPVQRDRLAAGIAEAIDAYFSGEPRVTAG